MKFVYVLPSAQQQFDQAADDYESKASGLGQRFVRAVDRVLNRVGSSPRSFGIIRGRTRFAIVRKFPFLVLFLNRRDRIVVTAIVPGRSNPKSWRMRT